MGALGGLLGLGGGQSGTGINPSVAAGQVPGTTAIQNPATVDQANGAYGNVQNSMGSQNALLAALQGQNGLSLQNQAASGFQNLANGTGPNPAMAQLNQTTASNVAQTGAQMAGQRGASQNVGLMTRQVGQQGAATQQQAAGQAATMAAQQQLAGIQGLAGQANTMAGQQIGQVNANVGAQQSEQANLLNALSGQNNANIGMASNINNANAGLANTQLQGQQGMLGGLLNTIGGGSSMLGGARGGMVQGYDEGGQVDASAGPDIGSPSFSSDSGAAALAGGIGPKSGGGGGGGGGGGMMSMLPMLMMAAAEGGEVPMMAEGGAAPLSMFGQFLAGVQTGSGPSIGSASFGTSSGAAALKEGVTNAGKKLTSSSEPKTTPVGQSTAAKNNWGSTDLSAGKSVAPTSGATGLPMGGSMMAASGGEVPALLSKGERYLSPEKAEAVAAGKADPIKDGKKVPGSPKYPGNDYRNDVVKAELQPGGIVIPNEILQGKDAEKRAISFVQSVLAKHRK